MTAASRNPETGNTNIYIASGAIPVGSLVMYHTVEGQVIVTSGVTSLAIGVALTTAADGDQVQIQTGGIVKVLTSGICTVGVGVVPGASGKCVTEASSGSTANSFGIAEQTTTADGTLLRVRWRPGRSAANT